MHTTDQHTTPGCHHQTAGEIGTCMPSANPGVSAAGEAAGRSALNPSAGPAAIGGMLVPGEEPEVEPSEHMKMQMRLSEAVSDLAKLAHAMEVLSINRLHEGVAGSENGDRRADGADEGVPPPPTRDSPNGDSALHVPRTMGAVAEGPRNFGDFAKMPGPSAEAQRQAASHYRT